MAILKDVQDLEGRLHIDRRWERGSAEWLEAEELSVTRTYRLTLDKLEGLIVARMFELTKMNMSQTGE